MYDSSGAGPGVRGEGQCRGLGEEGGRNIVNHISDRIGGCPLNVVALVWPLEGCVASGGGYTRMKGKVLCR